MVASPAPLVRIACPRCGTQYQLSAETLGPRGRKVTCAHCRETWHAEGAGAATRARDPDRMFDADAEDALDRAFVEAEQRARGEAMADVATVPALPPDEPRETAPGLGPTARPSRLAPIDRRALGDFARRQTEMVRHLPLAKLRRAVRIASVSLLAVLGVGAIAMRTELVRQFPALAGVYEAVGLKVNTVGIEFRDVRTLIMLRGGSEVMQVDARLYNVAPRGVAVPPVVVTLLDDAGAPIYEWSVRAPVRQLDPGETSELSTQLSSPPPNAARLRLTFANADANVFGSPAREANN